MIPTNRFPRTLVFFAIASTSLALWLMGGAVPPVQSAPASLIQAAIDAASDGGTVVIQAGTYTESLTIDKNLTLTGALSSTTIIQAVSGQRVITVTAGNNLRIENLTVTGGQAGVGNDGGGIYVENGNLTLVNSRITNNSARYGGGIHGGDASRRVDVIGSILELNHANFDGGALYALGSAALTNTQVLSNTAGRHGGGVEIWNGRGDLVGGIFRTNTAAQDGGGVNVNNSIGETGTQFISNTASRYGGGLHQWNMGPSVSIVNARFERNTAVAEDGQIGHAKGGGMRAGGATTISGTLFLSNTVYGYGTTVRPYGGGAHISNTLQVKASTFTGNEAHCTSALPIWSCVARLPKSQRFRKSIPAGLYGSSTSCGYPSGGGLSIEGSSTSAVIEDSVFENGWAWQGAGVYRYEYGPGSVTVRRSTFRDNSGGYGAGIFTDDAQVENSSFLRNSADNEGGGLSAQTAVVTATRFISNTVGDVPGGGGGIGIRGHMDGTNLLFAENQGGGANTAADLYLQGFDASSLRHVTIAHSSMSASPAIRVSNSTLNVRNSIIVSHTVGIDQTGGIVDVDYTLFFGGMDIQSSAGTLITGTHNLTGHPQFVSPYGGDYHLMPSSPAIDYGANLGVTTDLDGHSRPVGANPDLGAYEFEPLPEPLPKLYLPFLRKN